MTKVYNAKALTMAGLAGKIKAYNADRFDMALGVAVLESVIGRGFETKKYALVGRLDDFAVVLDHSTLDYFHWPTVMDFKDEFGDVEFNPDVIITDSPGEVRRYLRGLKL